MICILGPLATAESTSCQLKLTANSCLEAPQAADVYQRVSTCADVHQKPNTDHRRLVLPIHVFKRRQLAQVASRHPPELFLQTWFAVKPGCTFLPANIERWRPRRAPPIIPPAHVHVSVRYMYVDGTCRHRSRVQSGRTVCLVN